MAARTAASLFLMLSADLVLAPVDLRNITASPGKDATMTCPDVDRKSFITVEWRRAEDDEHVIVFRNGKITPVDQHPSYKDRVDLQMKDGNVSLVLKNVTINDSGTYECRVLTQENGEMKHICSIYLDVPPQGNLDGSKGDGGNNNGSGQFILGGALKVAAAAATFSFLILAAVIRIKRNTDLSQNSPTPPDEPSQHV
ncbi:V-set and immunoglobulin domain-containing protein 1-like isoform X2 [Girardinichthys multiradiatus]|uniref:V-set and immunoglobulin domain-containing protein 1-like isoform X2 n=1 Tax=Girardinichthys multiradiatus TaxID=208333 RepID=UPI001FAE5F0E|nr:V-set and immunoglobulin domain-containing protein 1-like isoform X2 [Girardinichthys multiradiatus]